MLRWRLFLGTVFVALLAALFWWDHVSGQPGICLFPLAIVVTALAAQEMLALLAARNLRPIPGIVYAGCLGVVLANLAPVLRPESGLDMTGWTLAGFGVAILALFAGEMYRYERPGEVLERLGAGVLCVAYVGLLVSFLVQMRFLGPQREAGKWGVPAIASMIIVVKMCDIGAYTVGRLFGKHKMAPTLSPGKTMEGAAGGVVFALLGSWLALWWLLPLIGVTPRFNWTWVGYGLALGVVGMLGDLAESLIKRDAGRKDSSTWMPGFGGVLDLVDSVLFCAPVAWLLWKLGWVV